MSGRKESVQAEEGISVACRKYSIETRNAEFMAYLNSSLDDWTTSETPNI